MESYKRAFNELNDEQRSAVKQIDGPVLVIAGPGTGKTQLISNRVGYILENTDTPADAILLLTFTEAGVQAMRERLNSLISKSAYDVQLSTYHAFGGEIFRQYPDYFEGAQLSLIEELSVDTLLRGIIAKLPYTNPLKFADNYIGDIKTFISDAKRSLLSPEDIELIAKDNLKTLRKLNQSAKTTLAKITTVSKKAVPQFESLLEHISSYTPDDEQRKVLPITTYAQKELKAALEHFSDSGKTTLISEWKRHWLAKDEVGNFIFDGQRLNQRLEAAANIYKKYQQSLRAQHLYDYDDMILRAIETLEANTELKYSLAERYSYIMLDEFQDTNAAQFKLVQLLSDHPVNEGRPNILAVGDDDQAIYAFQGAEHANMAAFSRVYKDVMVISLKDNYRTHKELLKVGSNIAEQISTRLHHSFSGITKEIVAANDNLPKPPKIVAKQFKSDAAQYNWLSLEIDKLIKTGVAANEIAVLAPMHKYLLPLLPYLSAKQIPIHYERRENVLDEPLIRQLEQMSQLVLALAAGDETRANSIWPEVLSYDYWQFPTDKIWRINWAVRESHEPWTAQLLNDDTHNYIASFFLKLASLLPLTTLEQQLDALVGIASTTSDLNLQIKSPLYDYYFSKEARTRSASEFTKLVSDLNVVRSRLADWRRNEDEALGLEAFVQFIEGHRAAGLNILNTSPYHETSDAVNLLTAYGAKGREFLAVFVVAAMDEVWGSSSRNQGYRLSLPTNLSYIRYQGATEDERLRLLFVASTRARRDLYFTSYTQDLAGKRFTPLKYLEITEQDGQLISAIIPSRYQAIGVDTSDTISRQAVANYWQERHLPPLNAELKQVLKPRLQSYKLNPTDLIKFTDIINNGPESFFMGCFLRFPSAPSVSSAYGTAIHNTLRFVGRIFTEERQLPTNDRVLEIFTAQLGRIDLPADELNNVLERGKLSLSIWLAQQGGSLKPTDRYEYNFSNEGSTAGNARLGGVVDRLVIDEKSRTITVIDYKVGQSYKHWQTSVVKLHNFKKQLLIYKLLIESSARFRGYTVKSGIIEFVEPDEQGNINRLELAYSSDDIKWITSLINGVWSHIQQLELPDVSEYAPTIAGIRQFEQDLTQQKNRP